MAGGGAFLGFGKGTVIEPNDCVPTIFAVPGDRDRLTVAIADNEGAGGVEAEANDMGGIGAGGGHGLAHGGADGGPDLGAVMLGMIGVRTPPLYGLTEEQLRERSVPA